MLGHGGSSAGSYLADPTSPIPSHCTVIIVFQKCRSVSIVVTGTVRVNQRKEHWKRLISYFALPHPLSDVIKQMYVQTKSSQHNRNLYRRFLNIAPGHYSGNPCVITLIF